MFFTSISEEVRGGLGFYKKIREPQAKKLIGDFLKKVYDIKYVPVLDAEGNQVEKPKPIYKFFTQKNKLACFNISLTDLFINSPANEHLIPFLNGTLDARTGELLKHDRNNYLTWNIPYDYKATSECPKIFKDFIDKAFGNEYFELIQAIFSMYLDSTAPYGYFLHVIGASGSGKGTLLRLLASLFNTENVMATGSFEELMLAEKRHQFLSAKRFCYFPDVGGFQGGLTSFYELVDNGMLSGRALRGNDGYAKKWNVRFALASVSHLGIENAGTGWDRRCIPIPTQPRQGDIDTELFEKLSDKKAQIIAWALSMKRERRDYLIKNSNSEFSGIRELKQQAAIYSDSMKGFIDQCLEPASENETLSTDALYAAYRVYCNATGLKPTAQNKLISRLAEEITQHHRARTTKRFAGSKPINIPRHFAAIKFTNNIFCFKDGEWHCDRGSLSEGNMQLFEENAGSTNTPPIQALQADSGMIKVEHLYPESATVPTTKEFQKTDSTDSTDSRSKTLLYTEKSEELESFDGDLGINKKVKTKSTLNRSNRLNRQAEMQAEPASQPIQGTGILPDSPLNRLEVPESLESVCVEKDKLPVVEETSTHLSSPTQATNDTSTPQCSSSVAVRPTQATNDTSHARTIKVGDVVAGIDPRISFI